MSESGRNMPDDLAAIREEYQAIVILRTLEREVSGTLHDGMLSWMLDRFAMDNGRDALLALLDRLERQKLVVKVQGDPEVVIVRLTDQGSRVAQGRDRAEGVLRVFPNCPY